MIRTAAADMYTTAKPTVLLDEDNRVVAVVPPDSPINADALARLLNDAMRDYLWCRDLYGAGGRP